MPDVRGRPTEPSADVDPNARADRRVEELLERAARAEGKAAVLHEALARAEARADRLEAEHRATVAELRAELAEARRPWLAKVLEGLRRKGS